MYGKLIHEQETIFFFQIKLLGPPKCNKILTNRYISIVITSRGIDLENCICWKSNRIGDARVQALREPRRRMWPT